MSLKRWVLYACVATLALGAMAFAACGGDDDDSSSGGSTSSGGNGTDEKFVADICKAGANFSDAVQKLLSDPTKLASEGDAAKALAGPMDDFANAFAKANPPKDLKSWHDDASKAMKDAAKELKAGKTDGTFFSGDSPIGDPPKEAQDRLTKIADNNKDCQKADLDFSGTGS